VTKELLTKNQNASRLAESFWYRNPKRMIQYKAKGMILRDLYPDVIHNKLLVEETETIPYVGQRSSVETLDVDKLTQK
jgi:hypothetical protein